MYNLSERVAYLRGLTAALTFEENTKEAMVLDAIVDVLEEFAEVLDETIDTQDDIQEYIELMDEDLSDVEEIVFSDYDEFDDDEFDWECDDECDECDECGLGYGEFGKYVDECGDKCDH